jgi:hypothetical protein
MRSVSVVGLSLFSAWCLSNAGIPAANAEPVCGMVATSDVALTDDLDCPGTAIVIGADSVVIDLKGHRVTAPNDYRYYAIYNDGYDQVTVKNGTIEGTVLLDNDCQENTLSSLLFLGELDQIWSSRTIVDLDDSSYGTISNNTFIHSNIIFSENSGVENLVVGNRFEYGFINLQGQRHIIRDNWIDHGGMGNDEGHGLQIIGNRIRNGYIGTSDVGGGTVIAENSIDGSPDWYSGLLVGISISDCHEAPGPNSVRIIGNRVMNATGDGIHLDETCSVDNSYVAGNHAFFNNGIGIDAPGQPVDGGNNVAKRNRGDPQCVGVACH